MSTETCSVCGAPLVAGAERCPSCGVAVDRTDRRTPADHGPADPGGEAAGVHSAGWYRAAFVLLGLLFVASAIAVLHMELALR